MELMAGVAAISFSPLAVKAVSFTAVVGAFYRSLYAALFFLLFALLQRAPRFSAHPARWFLPSLFAGAFLGIDLALWHKTIFYLGAGPATFLGNSQIIFVTVFAAVVFREKVPAVFYAFVAVILAGLYMLLPPAVFSVSRLQGYAMGLAVGITYAGMLICLRYAKIRSAGHYPELSSLFVCFAASALTVAVFAFYEGSSLFRGDARSHIVMALTAFFCQGAGWYFINTNITRIPAHEGSLLLMLQPVLATAWGALLFREETGAVQCAGIILALAGIVLYQTRFAGRAKIPGLEQ
jgi:drug/metabolite transporter (DMT)-like permease